MNLPVLGALFRSRDYQRKETELMIMVTPYIAKPMDAAQVTRPDDGFVEARRRPDRAARPTEQALRRRRRPAAGRSPSRGTFGFITD